MKNTSLQHICLLTETYNLLYLYYKFNDRSVDLKTGWLFLSYHSECDKKSFKYNFFKNQLNAAFKHIKTVSYFCWLTTMECANCLPINIYNVSQINVKRIFFCLSFTNERKK